MHRSFRSLAILAAATALFLPAPATLYADDDVRHLAEKKEEEHKGEKKDLGSKEVAGYTVKVTQVGDVKPGEEAVFLLVVSGGAGKPKAIRAWVGVESAEGSAKTKAEDEEKEWHAHVESPKPVPDKSQLWLEVEAADGKKKVAFDYKK
ncbi:MAG: hypothetical protein ACAI43_20025 [Phycisphaerae bacterium]